jgi:hypothetical protein
MRKYWTSRTPRPQWAPWKSIMPIWSPVSKKLPRWLSPWTRVSGSRYQVANMVTEWSRARRYSAAS